MNVRRSLSPVVVLAAACVVAGCSNGRPRYGTDWPDGQELPILRETSGAFSDYARPLRTVIYDRRLLSELALGGLTVDFAKEMVLLAAMGPAPSSACRMRIARIWRDSERLRVHVESIYPPGPMDDHAGVYSPYHAVVVPRCDLPIERFSSRLPRGAFRAAAARGP